MSSPSPFVSSRLVRSPLPAALAALLGAALLADPSSAHLAAAHARPNVPASIPVTTCDDDLSPGSFREVLHNAVDGETVDLTALQCSSISLAYGAVFVTVDDLTIAGNGQTIYGDINQNVLTHTGQGLLSLQHINLADSAYDGRGGCLYSAGSVYLGQGSIHGCTASDAGGGMFVKTALTVKDSVISGNSVGPHMTTLAAGGGAYSLGDLTVIGSTISSNSANGDGTGSEHGYGGGIVSGGVLDIEQSTISGNHADAGGGVIGLGMSNTLRDSTLTGNAASEGAGAFVTNTITMNSDTIAFNTQNACITAGCEQGALQIPNDATEHQLHIDNAILANNDGFDLIVGSGFAQGTHNLIMLSDFNLGGTLSADPHLLPLAVNGSQLLARPMTLALAADSPAINAGGNVGSLETDERGLPRTVGTAPDIGAYESNGDDIFADGFDGN